MPDNFDKLEKRVRFFQQLILLFGFVTFSLYLLWFGVLQRKSELSSDPAIWGQFGDFIGGLLNPLIAFAAFYWLSNSILMQSKELALTREALLEAATAQSAQVKHGHQMLRLQSLNSLAVASESNIALCAREIEFVSEQYACSENWQQAERLITLHGDVLEGPIEIAEFFAKKSALLGKLRNARDQILNKIRAEMDSP